MDEAKILKDEICKLEQKLADYMKILPILNVSDKDSERVINLILDDINIRKKRIEELK